MPRSARPRAPEDEEVPEQDKRKDEETDKRCDPTAYPNSTSIPQHTVGDSCQKRSPILVG